MGHSEAISPTAAVTMAEGKFFVIRSVLNDLVLDVQNNTAEPGNPVAPWHFHGGDNQLWYEDYINGCIRSALDDNFVLEIQGDSLTVNHFNPNEAMQRWTVSGDHICNKDNPDSVLDIAAHDTEPGARVCCWDNNGGPNQQWTFDYQPPRYCFIKSCMNDKVLDIKANDDSPGTEVIMWERKEGLSDNQLWYEDRYGCLRSKMSDLAIDCGEGDAVTNEYMPSIPGQQWVKIENRILNRLDPDTCLDIKRRDDSDGANLIAYQYKGSDNQHWEFEYI